MMPKPKQRVPMIVAGGLGALAMVGVLVQPRVGSADARSVSGTARLHASGKEVDWDRGFIDPSRVGSVSEAARHLPFTPHFTASLGQPFAIYVHRRVRDRGKQAVAYIYQHDLYGRFLVYQSRTRMTQADLEAHARRCPTLADCPTITRMVTLARGTPALLVAGPVSNGVIWLRHGIRLNAFGPTETFSVADAQAVASAIAR